MSQISLDNVTFRVASVDDAQALLDIYAYYVNETAIKIGRASCRERVLRLV